MELQKLEIHNHKVEKRPWVSVQLKGVAIPGHDKDVVIVNFVSVSADSCVKVTPDLKLKFKPYMQNPLFCEGKSSECLDKDEHKEIIQFAKEQAVKTLLDMIKHKQNELKQWETTLVFFQTNYKLPRTVTKEYLELRNLLQAIPELIQDLHRISERGYDLFDLLNGYELLTLSVKKTFELDFGFLGTVEETKTKTVYLQYSKEKQCIVANECANLLELIEFLKVNQWCFEK